MKNIIKTITKHEWRFVIIITIFVMVITTLPYLYAYYTAPAGMSWNGIHSLASGDLPIYFSYINQVKHGDFLIKDHFTSEHQQLGTFNIVWFVVGYTAKIFNLSPVFAFHAARVFLIPFLLAILYIILSYFFKDKTLRKLSFFIASFASGVGLYFATFFASSKLDYYFHSTDLCVTESNLFSTMFQTSHFILSYIMLLSIFLLILLAFDSNKIKYSILAGLISLVFFNFHPYYLLTVFLIPSVYLGILILKEKKILWKPVMHLAIIFLLSLPSIIYHLWLIVKEPIIGIRASQNISSLDSFWTLIPGFGFLWLFSIVGIYLVIKHKKFDNKFLFAFIWLITSLFLIFLPTQFSSRYTEGLIIPLVIFSTIALVNIYHRSQQYFSKRINQFLITNKFLLITLFVLFIAPTNFLNLVRDTYYFTTNYPPVFYLEDGKINSWNWLKENTDQDSVVIADPNYNSFFVPVYSLRHVFVAHEHETLHFFSKFPLNVWFYKTNDNDTQKQKLLKRKNINYIFYSPEEKELGDFQPDEKDYLKKVYQEGESAVYQFIDKGISIN